MNWRHHRVSGAVAVCDILSAASIAFAENPGGHIAAVAKDNARLQFRSRGYDNDRTA